MPIYDYQCEECKTTQEVLHGIEEHPVISCDKCSSNCVRVILSAPGVCIPPIHQAAGSLIKYYGITDPVTGKGIRKDVDYSAPIGITKSQQLISQRTKK